MINARRCGVAAAIKTLLFARLQAAGANCLGCPVEPDHVDAVPFEWRVVSVPLRDGPVEEMADPCLESIQRDVSALGAPAGECGRPAQLRGHGFPSFEQFRDLARRLPGGLDSR